MADEKKPKIDLKARLGKPSTAAAPATAPTAGIPVPSVPPPAAVSSGGLPPPSGVPMPVPVPSPSVAPPPNLDPTNPLAAATGALRPQQAPQRPAAPATPPPPQRIEVDEVAVQEAAKSAFRKAMIAGGILAVAFGAVGFVAGGASTKGDGIKASVRDAADLKTKVTKSKTDLEGLATKLEEGAKALGERKFPTTLAKDLGGINVDFDGTQLGGRRFAAFKPTTVAQLVSYVTAVQDINDRKSSVVSLLNRLQKPLEAQFADTGKGKISYVVVFTKDPSQNLTAVLSPLTAPIAINDPAKVELPKDFAFINPLTKGNMGAPATTSKIDEKSAIYVLPKSVDANFPSETAGSVAQLRAQLGNIVAAIRGEKAPAGGDAVTESKPGLSEASDKLVKALEEIH